MYGLEFHARTATLRNFALSSYRSSWILRVAQSELSVPSMSIDLGIMMPEKSASFRS
jgi:hypothetical protein